MATFSKRVQQDFSQVSEKDLRVAELFAVPFLEDIYYEAIKRVKLYRALKNIKKTLRHVLKTKEMPSDLNVLTRNVYNELKQQDVLEDIEMKMIASIIEKCFRIVE